jgi:uncharacterized flavoprotein (TIGR03862 family)
MKADHFDLTVVGAGPAGLMACEVLSAAGLRVLLIDRKSSPGRKFLLAGRGGLNLTHAEPLEKLLTRYGHSRERLQSAISAFPPQALIEWCNGLGIETFEGTSGRIFPKGLKASPLLRNWLRRLQTLGVTFKGGTEWPGFDGTPAILALGGASWPEMGSNGSWASAFRERDITVIPFAASNCRQGIDWSKAFVEKHAGAFVKNVTVSHAGQSIRGEMIIASNGIEGTPIYALAASIRASPSEQLRLDLKPDMSSAQVAARLQQRPKSESFNNRYRKALSLSPAAIGLMREANTSDPKDVRLNLNGHTDLKRAISTAGGVCWSEIDGDFRLKKFPDVQVIGEMIDWEAPTGGYLLQACFAMGYAAAQARLAIMRREGFLPRLSSQP